MMGRVLTWSALPERLVYGCEGEHVAAGVASFGEHRREVSRAHLSRHPPPARHVFDFPAKEQSKHPTFPKQLAIAGDQQRFIRIDVALKRGREHRVMLSAGNPHKGPVHTDAVGVMVH